MSYVERFAIKISSKTVKFFLVPMITTLITANVTLLILGPGTLASNVAQGGAALAIALKTKDKNKKALVSSAGITAICGITEPALYGVTLQNKAAL